MRQQPLIFQTFKDKKKQTDKIVSMIEYNDKTEGSDLAMFKSDVFNLNKKIMKSHSKYQAFES